MSDEELAQYVIEKLSKKVDDAVVTLSNSDETQLKFSNSKIVSISSWNMKSISLFAASGKKLAITTLKDMTKEAADKTVDDLLKYANASMPNPEYAGIAKGPFKYEKVGGLFDSSIAENKVDFVSKLKAAIAEAKTMGVSRCAGVIEYSTDKTLLLTTNNVKGQEDSTDAYFSFRAITDSDTSGHRIAVARGADSINFLELARDAANIALQAREPKEIQPGRYTVLFDPLPFANIIDHVGGALSAFYVDAGLSWFKDMLGQGVASNLLTLRDTGNLAGGAGSSAFDEEGMPTRDTLLIEKGVLRGYLHNTSTAEKYNTQSTANAGIISPHPTNLVVSPGTKSKEELIRMVDDGIYVTNTWYTRFNNHSTGDFSTIPRDGIFRIKNGSIKYPLKDIRISENMNHLLSNLIALGSDSTQLRGWEVSTPVIAPSALIRNVNITKPN